MSLAVDLDDKFFLAANEVGEIGTDRLLPNELEPAENTISKSPSEQPFSLSLVLSQVSRPAHFLEAQSAHEIPCLGHSPAPLTPALSPPRRGEGDEPQELCTPLTYQSSTARSASFIRSPLARRSLPD